MKTRSTRTLMNWRTQSEIHSKLENGADLLYHARFSSLRGKMMRRSLVVANWKMNGALASAKSLVEGILADLGNINGAIAVCVPYVQIPAVSQLIKGTK